MKLSLINFSNSLPDEIRKLLSVIQPTVIYTGKDDYELQEFCYHQRIDIINIGGKRILLCCKCEEVIDSSDLTIIICGDTYPKNSDLFKHSLEYCKKYRKDFMVYYDE